MGGANKTWEVVQLYHRAAKEGLNTHEKFHCVLRPSVYYYKNVCLEKSARRVLSFGLQLKGAALPPPLAFFPPVHDLM